MKRNERPLIGVTMRHELETERFYLARAYGEAIEAAGGIPVHISLIPNADYVAHVLRTVQGVVLPGSASDVDPVRYDREPHRRLGSVHPLRDATDLLVLGEAERRNLPVLAICFGMQILNVSRGGALMQDIESEMADAIKHEQGAPRGRRSHRINLAPHSLIGGLAGNSEVFVNSHHHQAIETLGRDLRATAWTSDGLVEAVEDISTNRWVLGVQWHPEIEWEEDAFARAIFGAFTAAACRHREMAAEHASGGGSDNADWRRHTE